MNKIIFVSVLASLVVLPIFSNEVQAESIIGNYAAGYEDGKENGANDYYDGNGWDSSCPSGSGLSYCTGYKLGYTTGQTAARTLE